MSYLSLTKEEFRTWLLSKASNEVVGLAKSSQTCPISNYHLDNTIYNSIYTVPTLEYQESYALHSSSGILGVEKVFLKRWQWQFGSKVDLEYFCRDITAQKALEILDSVCEEDYDSRN